VWAESFGWANREQRIPSTPHTPYSLASISKPITATGLMRLVEQGKVDLDRPANDYLGRGKLTGLAGDASGATVRRVLSHTAGLPLHYQFFYAGLPYSEPPMDETIARYGILVNPPGAVYHYSNLGYGIIDRIIERTSGLSYAEYMRRDVFEPLGMTRSSVHLDARTKAHAAERYDAEGKPIPYYDFDHDGGSAVYASAHDLVRFGMFHLGQRLPGQRPVISDETRRAMQRVETPEGRDRYGLGWAIGEEAGMRRISHTGSMPGVTTILNLYPDEGVVSVVLLNSSNAPGRARLAQMVAASILPQLSASSPERRAPSPEPRAPDRREPVFAPTPEQVGEWTGTLRTWEGELPFIVRIEKDGDVKVRVARQLWTLLNQVSWNGDRLVGRFAARIPTADAGRHPHTIQLDLRLRDGKLRGQATAQTTDQPVYFALSSYVEVARQPAGTR
jgi:CubicO group peptidase (beta-lactamase class C family)